MAGRSKILGATWRWLKALPAAMAPAGLILPALSVSREPQHGSLLYMAICLGVAGGFAALAIRLGRARVSASFGWAAILAGGVLLEQASYPGAAAVVAAGMGWGIGSLVEFPPPRRWRAASGVIGGCETLVLVRFSAGVLWAGLLLAVLAGFCLWPLLRARHGWARPSERAVAGSVVAALLTAVATFWVGSTSPSVEWFGQLTSHGPRDRMEVALTFDDGPNGASTLDVATVLEEHGAHGTFFVVGKAVVAEPEVAGELINRGHVLGNHSYHHDAISYLEPGYSELMLAQEAIGETLGFCPALFRPPHGTHTPFMSHIVSDRAMRLVTWDVSARDWVEDDPARLAANILAKVKPGSIILLHDGIDGIPPVDRSVVVRALPAILDGLKARGLTPVTLDKMLDIEPYRALPECTAGARPQR